MKGTYLGDCAWKSNLSRAAFLWAGGEDRGTDLSQAAGRSGRAATGTHPRPSLHPDPNAPTPLTFFSSFLAGLPPGSEALGSVEKHYLSLGRPCLGGRVGMGFCSPSPPRTGTSGSRGLHDLPATSPGAPAYLVPGGGGGRLPG